MESNQDDPDFWDRLASENFAETSLGNDSDPIQSEPTEGPAPSSSVPSAESANPSIGYGEFFDSFNTFDGFDPLFEPSRLPAPTQTANFMQAAQSISPTEDDILRFVDPGAVAPYTDRQSLEASVPIVAADPLPAALSADFTEYSVLPFSDHDLGTPYAFPDLSNPLAPTTTTRFRQAAQSADLMEGETSHIIELDRDPVMASVRDVPTSSDRPAPDTASPAEIAESTNSAMAFIGTGVPNQFDWRTCSKVSIPPPVEIDSTTSVYPERSRSISGLSLSQRQHRRILPKPSLLPQDTESAPARNSQATPSLLDFPSKVTPVSQNASITAKDKCKRSRNPQPYHCEVPETYLHILQTAKNLIPAKKNQRQEQVTKTLKSAKTCLRCQDSHEGCSGTFPCDRCKKVFRPAKANKRSQASPQRHCIDSDIVELDTFHQIGILMPNMDDFFSHYSTRRPATGYSTNIEPADLRKRGFEAAERLTLTIENLTAEDGLPLLHGFMTRPIMVELLPERSLRRHAICSHHSAGNVSLAWVFAASIIQPDALAELAGFSGQEMQHFSAMICLTFFQITANLLRKARNSKLDDGDGESAKLSEHLEMIHCLMTYHSIQDRLARRFEDAVIHMVQTPEYRQSFALLMIAVKETPSDNKGVPTPTVLGDTTEANAEDVCKLLKKCDSEDTKYAIYIMSFQEQTYGHFVKALNSEGWDHLRSYAQHWLKMLEIQPNRISRVMANNLMLNALCRYDHKSGIEDKEQFSSGFHRKRDLRIFAEADEVCRALDRQVHEAFPDFLYFQTSSLRSIPAVHMKSECIYCRDHEILRWTKSLLNGLGRLSALEQVKRKDRDPEAYKKHALGFSNHESCHNHMVTAAAFRDLENFIQGLREMQWGFIEACVHATRRSTEPRP